jgi:hypothetical protein
MLRFSEKKFIARESSLSLRSCLNLEVCCIHVAQCQDDPNSEFPLSRLVRAELS